MSIVDALKKLVVAFGGASEPEEVPGANVADVIEELAKNPPSGGGTAPLVVNISTDNNGSIMNRTFREIEDAVLSGRYVLVYEFDEEIDMYGYFYPSMIGKDIVEADNIQYCVNLGEFGVYFAETKDDYPAVGDGK